MTRTKVLICPYCGDTQQAGERCRACGGLFEPLSRQATHNAMGPWFIRDENRAFQPGCSYETLIKLIERQQVNKYSILRSPTTKQFWTVAKRVPGIAHLLGYCHNCDASVDPGDHGCYACGVPFGAYLDRNYLGLPDIRPLPWEAGGEEAQPGAAASARTLEFHRAAEPIGISSFASDEELRRSGLSSISHHAYPADKSSSSQSAFLHTARWGQSSGAQESRPGPASAISQPASAEPHAGGTARSMQRRMDQQARTIKMLVIAVLVMGALSILCFSAILASRKTATTGEQDQSLPAAPVPSVLPAEALTPNSENAFQSEPPPPATSPVSANQPADAPAAADYAAEYIRAQGLITQAEQTERALPERIADYEEALKILRTIEKAPVDQRPDGLDQRIGQIERELERLKLQEFFP